MKVWVGSVVFFAFVQYFWIEASWVSVLAILFTGLISSSLSMAFAYFLLNRLTGPLIEEVGAQLEVLPDVSSARVTFFFKAGISVMAMTVLAFMAFGVVVYSLLASGLDEYALRTGAGTPGHWPDSFTRRQSLSGRAPGGESRPPVYLCGPRRQGGRPFRIWPAAPSIRKSSTASFLEAAR